MMQTPAAGQAKRRRRTQDDLDECKEKLPLEDDDLLARLVMQQRAALQDYRRQVNTLRQQQQQQQQQAAEAARCAAAVADAWAALNADLLLLLPQQQQAADPALQRSVQALLQRPGLCLFDCANPEGSSHAGGTSSCGDGKKGGSSNSGRTSKTDGASSDDEDEAFHSLVQRDYRSSSPVPSGTSCSSSNTDSEVEQLKQRLLACRKWSSELLQQLVLQLIRRRRASDTFSQEKVAQKGAPEVQAITNNSAGSPDAAGASTTDNVNSDTTSKTPTAEVSPRATPAPEVEAAPAAAAAVAATAAGVCPKCLALQSALRRLRLRAGGWRTRARIAEQQQQQSAIAAAAADLEISRLKKQQVMLRAAAGAPAATALLAAALRGEEIKDDMETADSDGAQQEQQPTPADAAAAPKGSSPLSPGAGEAESDEQQQQQQQANNNDDDEDADAAVLLARLQQKEQQLQEMAEEQTKLRKVADDAAALPTLRRMQIMKSPPFIELQQLCAQRDAVLAAKSAEVDELRRELLAEQSKADAAFEELARKQTEAREQLSERIMAVLEENQTLKAQKEDALREVEAVKKQLEASQQLRQELETASAQRALQLTQMRMQFDQLKNASNQVLVRNERLKTEKQRIIEALRTSEVSRLRLAGSLRSGEASAVAADGAAVGDAATSTTAATAPTATGAAATVKEATVKAEETQPADKGKTTNDTAEAEGQLLRIELETMQRRLNEQQELEAEVMELRQQYSRVTEELEEVSKAFEERQTHCEHLLRQLKARDEMLLQQKAAADAALQQQALLQRIGRLQEQKVQLEKQHVDQLTASARAFSEALKQAQDRAAVADQQRDEIASCFQAVRAEREKLFRDNDEMARELQLLTETNKASESCLEQHQAKVQSLEASLRRQSEARAEADKRLEKFKERQEKQERKRLLAAAEDPSLAINHLLQEENDTMRRRLLCGVCNERFKDHMLVKCGHMFCQECIEKNVKARNRKCPHCKTQFDQKDTRKAYLHN